MHPICFNFYEMLENVNLSRVTTDKWLPEDGRLRGMLKEGGGGGKREGRERRPRKIIILTQ